MSNSVMIMSILFGIFLSLIAFITALGNIVVLLAFYCDRKLRTINDYFILNMAIADFLVGFICIPFYIPFSLTGSWPFGSIFCKIWVTIDDVATMASVINIVAISINRYWSIAYPLSYRKYVRQHFVYLVMAAIWLLSFVNFAPGIWLLGLFQSLNSSEMNISRNDCSGDYNQSFVYMIIAQFNYFIWPFIVLCVLNMLLMLNIWKRGRKMTRLRISSQRLRVKETNDDEQQRTSRIEPTAEKDNAKKCSPSCLKQKTTNRESNVKRVDCRESTAIICYSRPSTAVINRSDSLVEYGVDSEFEISRPILHEVNSPPPTRQRGIRPGQCRIIRDRRAARSLFILVIVFLIFLFPYVICATASTAGANISSLIFEISFWLLWLNSTCNPFLYPFIQIKYRNAYVKLFRSITSIFSFSTTNRFV